MRKQPECHVTFRSYIFVINNPESTDLTPVLQSHQMVRYCIWQLERGEKDTTRIQGYLELTKSVRRAAVLKIFPTAWIEKRTGTRDQARESCRKPGHRIDGPWEYGEWINVNVPGQKTDMELLEQWLCEGKTEAEICDLNFHIWRSNIEIIRRYKALHTPNSKDSSEQSSVPTRDMSVDISPIAPDSVLQIDSSSIEQDISWDNCSDREIAIMSLKLVRKLAKDISPLVKDVPLLAKEVSQPQLSWFRDRERRPNPRRLEKA